MKNQNTTDLVGLLGCASRLGVPAKWLKAKALAGEIPCLRIGKRKLFFNVASVQTALLRMASAEYPPAPQQEARK